MLLKAGFILLTLLLVALLLSALTKISSKAFPDPAKRKRFVATASLVLGAWLLYSTVISWSGALADYSLPPRIPLLLVLPAFVFFSYFFTAKKFSPVIKAVPESWPVYFQSFRALVELLIYGMLLEGIVPQQATFAGRNFDIVAGITAPFIAWLFIDRIKNRTIALLWNCAGILLLINIVFILLSNAYRPSGTSLISPEFGTFPFTFLASFLMPAAVFMHILSIKRTLQERSHAAKPSPAS